MYITKKEFESYVRVQKSGVVNMFSIKDVCALTKLNRDQVFEIMNQYSDLQDKYFKVLEVK